MMVYLIGYPDQVKKQILCVLRALVVQYLLLPFTLYPQDAKHTKLKN